jgi:hypothetical protein
LWNKLVLGPLYLALTIPFLTFFATVSVVLRIRRGRARLPAAGTPVWSWSFVFVLWTILSLMLRGKENASINYFMPLIPIGILAMCEGFARIAARGLDGRRITAMAALAQLLMLAYNPTLFIPTKQATTEATALVDTLRKVDGPVWFPAFPSYAALAGKPWMTQYGTLGDLGTTNPGYVAGDLSRLIRDRYFGAILLYPDDRFVDRDELRRFYDERPLPAVHSPFLRRVHHIHVSGSLFVRRS